MKNALHAAAGVHHPTDYTGAGIADIVLALIKTVVKKYAAPRSEILYSLIRVL